MSGDAACAVMAESGRARALRRLKAVEGQVRGLQQMLEDGRYCVDVLTQIAAAQEALRGVAKLVMRYYLEHCATQGIRSDDPEEAAAIYDELMDVIFKYAK